MDTPRHEPLNATPPAATRCALIDAFIGWMKAEKGRSANTLQAYRADLRQWEDYATRSSLTALDPASVTVSDLRAWLAWLGSRGMEPRSMRRKVQSLRAFFRYLMQRHGLPRNPAADLRMPRLDKPLPVFVRQAETMAMLDDARRRSLEPATPGEALMEQARALVLDLFYSTGMRCSELLALNDADADTARGSLRVKGKGGKERIVPLGRGVCDAIDAYRAERDALWGAANAADPLILSKRGLRLGRKTVYSIVHEAMERNGVHAARLSPHVLRHSCATDLLRNGADLDNVRTLLGHASLETTQIYTHISDRELRDSYLAAHPRARAAAPGAQSSNYKH